MISTLAHVKRAEALLQRGVSAHPEALTSLLTALAAPGAPDWPLHLALLHALRRVFTALHHGGALAPAPPGASADPAGDWLRAQFAAFLSLLVRFLDGAAGERAESVNRA